jgi:putative hydrolase of the HAD superfamily
VRIRAVLFDIYGTLLVSNAGGTHPDPALRAAIASAHAASPHPYPEVDIREIHAALRPELSEAEIEVLAMEQECALNPVAPMPGVVEMLQALMAAGIAVGLVSNAQFYTVQVLEKALGASLDDLGVDLALCQFSYEVKRAKPDLCLFHAVRDALASRGVPATEVIYVGNDVQKDIDPARATGFRTALYAGDSRTLRLHGRTLEEAGADRVVNDLREIADLVT